MKFSNSVTRYSYESTKGYFSEQNMIERYGDAAQNKITSLALHCTSKCAGNYEKASYRFRYTFQTLSFQQMWISGIGSNRLILWIRTL